MLSTTSECDATLESPKKTHHYQVPRCHGFEY